MIGYRVGMVVLATLSAAACAGPGRARPTGSAPSPARSAKHTGTKIETGPAVLPDGGIGFGMEAAHDPRIPQTLMYEGLSTPPEDPLGSLGRVHCPATPAPRPSGYGTAIPFDEPSPF
jgi:hypothetical protein